MSCLCWHSCALTLLGTFYTLPENFGINQTTLQYSLLDQSLPTCNIPAKSSQEENKKPHEDGGSAVIEMIVL